MIESSHAVRIRAFLWYEMKGKYLNEKSTAQADAAARLILETRASGMLVTFARLSPVS